MKIARRACVVVVVGVLAACTSPEAKRARGGGAGADIGNRSDSLRLHYGSSMYAKTPCLLPKPQCPGPLAQSGLPQDFPAESHTPK
ncbi:MAG: hypothetical protein H0U66_03980 [Gemmatimonadaceae bacterium]|nr:hypothetical protein [Gemmatimonadaceae bacterium]